MKLHSLLLLLPLGASAEQFVLFDTTFTYTKSDADNSTPSKSHYYVKEPVLNVNRPRDWTAPVDYRNGTVHIRAEVLEKPPGGEETTWTICYIPNKGQGNGYGCTGTDLYKTAGVYEKDVPMTSFWENGSIIWSEGIKQMDLVIKDNSGGRGHAHRRADHEKFFPTKMRITLTQVSKGAAYMPPVPDDVISDMNVEYSRVGERMAMDIFRPRTPGPHPGVVAIHGGGFRRGSRNSYHALCIRLAQRGYVAATVSYRFAPRHQFPAPVEDVKAAVRFLRANAKKYDLDASYIGATGGSAGGHLALMLGLTGPLKVFEGSGPNLDQSSAVQAVVNYYGPTDFTQSYGKSVDAAEVLPLFLGNDLKTNRKAHVIASPLNYVTPLSPPILTVHGTEDAYVNYEQATWLAAKLTAAEVPTELETISGAGHGFRGADAARAEARLMAWFDRWLKPGKQTRIIISDHGPKGEVVGMLWPSGRELWTRSNERGHDVQLLENGNVLFTIGPQHKVSEFNPQTGQEVWKCCDGLDHPLAAQRLSNGNTLIGDAKAGRVIEVDKAGKTVWEYKSEDIQNMRMRNSHRTEAGTTLIAVEAVAKLIEVDKSGKIVWQWQAPEGDKRRMYMGRRLKNGNTVMSISDPGEIVEVDPSGKVVRSIAGKDMSIQFGWASGFDFLPNGNLIVSDYTGRRLVEVDKTGKVVNELRLGPRTVATVISAEKI